MNYFVWKLLNLRKVLIDLDESIDNIIEVARQDDSWHIWPSVWGALAKPFLDILTTGKDFIRTPLVLI